MIDVSEAVVSPDLAQVFTIVRSVGSFVNGVWKTQTMQIQLQGVISIASDRDLNMIPEGDVVGGAMVFHSDQPVVTTQDVPASPGSGTGYSSDILIWNGINFRVLRVAPYSDYGYYRAIATRMSTGA